MCIPGLFVERENIRKRVGVLNAKWENRYRRNKENLYCIEGLCTEGLWLFLIKPESEASILEHLLGAMYTHWGSHLAWTPPVPSGSRATHLFMGRNKGKDLSVLFTSWLTHQKQCNGPGAEQLFLQHHCYLLISRPENREQLGAETDCCQGTNHWQALGVPRGSLLKTPQSGRKSGIYI